MRFRILTSSILAITIAAVFSLSSLAAPDLSVRTPDSAENDGGERAARAVVGTCIAVGEVKIDGNFVTTGATVSNGDTIASGPDGDASVELGSLGRIQLRPNTTIKINLSSDNCRVTIERCGSFTQTLPAGVASQVTLARSASVEVAVSKGEARIKYKSAKSDSDKILKADETSTFGDLDQVSSTGESALTINCCVGCHPAALIPPGLVGLFAAIGATTIIIAVPRKDEPPQVSGTVPR